MFEAKTGIHLIDPSEISFGDEIGDGATAVVYKANYNRQCVAVKKFIGSCPMNLKKQMKNELDILSKIKHENIIKMFGYCDKRDSTFIVFEFMEGGSLFDLLMSEEKNINNCSLVKDICNGMDFLHSNSVLHLDLKSPNVLLNKTKSCAKITDFGIARISTLTTLNSTAAKTNRAKGSIRWMSPEVSKGMDGTRKSDVWAFGCILLEFITRQIPFASITDDAFFLILQNDKAELPIKPKIYSIIMASILCKCLERNPSNRPTFDQLSKLLEKSTTKDFEIDNSNKILKQDTINTISDLNKLIENIKISEEDRTKKIEEKANELAKQKEREKEIELKLKNEIAKLRMEQMEKNLEEERKRNEDLNKRVEKMNENLEKLRLNEISSQRQNEYMGSSTGFSNWSDSYGSNIFSPPINSFYQQSSIPSYNQTRSGRPTGEFFVSSGSRNGREIFQGPRGGLFIYTGTGNKSYIKK
ncbi:unnamed protein product [Brachionus calyciflorus]|uniref:Protein kinase domain-containing protein n=1 Tax=Brachionus calyciflorus TaxID=104777 RepID=A0A813NHC8_9BILA|nr:unnamed protein product [Brachionus calyciflorus]